MKPIRCLPETFPFCHILYKITRTAAVGEGEGYSIDENGTVAPITIGYWIVGVFRQQPELGKRFLVDRSIRNGVDSDGTFESTPVLDIVINDDHAELHTTNSIYKVEEWTTSLKSSSSSFSTPS